ncbi:hypothetical protein ScPMuIL_008718 [Solemya velum]
MELLFEKVKNQLKSPSDIIVCVLHWDLVTCGYKCIGVGDTDVTIKKTELLPKGWNESQDVFILRYTSISGEHYVFKVLNMEGTLLVHFMSTKDEKVFSTDIRISDYTTGDLSSLESALKNEAKLSKQFKKDIIDQMGSQKYSPKAGTSTTVQKERPKPYDDDPLRERPRHPQRVPPPEWADPDDPFAVGRGDLDPLGRGPGGMVFDPLRAGPRIRPTMMLDYQEDYHEVQFPQEPGLALIQDHMKPPGYDDMFM